MFHTRIRAIAVVSAAALAAGCTLNSPEPPPLTGPSTLALSLTAAASPDILPEDGLSRSVIRITARDEHGQLKANVPLRVDTVVGNSIVDIGTLSARNVTTNAAGEATVTYTAPMARFRGVDSGTVVTIAVRPVGTDYFGNSNGTMTSIRLVPESVVLDPGAPIPSFFFTPTNPKAGEMVFFDASSSSDPGGAIVSYSWSYGDGTFERGKTQPTESHDFVTAGSYFVTLTVTDNEGKSSSLTKVVTVSGS